MKILYRYIIKQFVLTLVFSLFALCIIFVIVNMLENLDDFIDQKATFKIVFNYYLYFLPQIIKLLTPVGVLLAALFSIGKMSTLNEIIAMKSGTMSLYRIMLPLMVFCGLLSVGQLYFNGWLVPEANSKKFVIEQKYLLKQKSGGPIYNLYFRDNPLKNVMMQYYDGISKTGNNIVIEEFSSERFPRLTSRIDAARITWDSLKSQWRINDAIVRTYLPNQATFMKTREMYVKLNIAHKEIIELKKSTEEMTFFEYKDYLDLMKRGGKDVREQLTDYYGGYAFPFANLIIVLFAVPFASIKKKGGLAIQISAAMVVTFLYLLFTEVSKNIGYASDMNPILAGWAANIIFLIVGIITIFKTKT